jgi:hypothetical protein
VHPVIVNAQRLRDATTTAARTAVIGLAMVGGITRPSPQECVR